MPFKNIRNRSRHEKVCNRGKLNAESDELKQQINKITLEKKNSDNEKEKYRQMVEYLTKRLERVTEIAINKTSNTTINNTLNFVNTNYTDANELKSLNNYSDIFTNYELKPADDEFDLSDDELDEIKKNDEFIKDIITYKKLKTLPTMLGDFLVNHYVKQDKSKQALHVTDSSRMKFMYTALKSNLKDIVWKSDPKGVNVGRIIIDPMLKYIHDQVIEFRSRLADKFINKPKEVHDNDIQHMEDCATLIGMLAKENNRKKDYNLKYKIIEYITPHFEFNKTLNLIEK